MMQALGRQEPRAAQSSTRLAQCRHRYCNVAQPLHGVAEPMANPALTHGFDACRRASDACRRVTDVQPPCLTCWHRKPTARPEWVFSCLPWGASYDSKVNTCSLCPGATPNPWGASCVRSSEIGLTAPGAAPNPWGASYRCLQICRGHMPGATPQPALCGFSFVWMANDARNHRPYHKKQKESQINLHFCAIFFRFCG